MNTIYTHETQRVKLTRGLNCILAAMHPNMIAPKTYITMSQIQELFPTELIESTIRSFIKDMLERGYILQTGTRRTVTYSFPQFVLDRVKSSGTANTAEFYVNQLYIKSQQHSLECKLKRTDTKHIETIESQRLIIKQQQETISQLEAKLAAITASITNINKIL